MQISSYRYDDIRIVPAQGFTLLQSGHTVLFWNSRPAVSTDLAPRHLPPVKDAWVAVSGGDAIGPMEVLPERLLSSHQNVLDMDTYGTALFRSTGGAVILIGFPNSKSIEN